MGHGPAAPKRARKTPAGRPVTEGENRDFVEETTRSAPVARPPPVDFFVVRQRFADTRVGFVHRRPTIRAVVEASSRSHGSTNVYPAEETETAL
jgi:hypothetical protein